MNVIEFFLIIFIITTFIFMLFKMLSNFLYAYMKKKSNLRIFEYKEKKDTDLYYENKLYKIKEKNNDFEL